MVQFAKHADIQGVSEKLEDFEMSRKLLLYQNILNMYLYLSILASSGLSNSKNYRKNEPRKAGEWFVEPYFQLIAQRK